MRDYSEAAKLIKIHSWPDSQQGEDGRWRRSFGIRFKESFADSTALPEVASLITRKLVEKFAAGSRPLDLRDDLEISFEEKNAQEIVATVISVGDSGLEEYMFAAWWMFEEIDGTLGTIELIEGYPRDNWSPWSLRQWRMYAKVMVEINPSQMWMITLDNLTYKDNLTYNDAVRPYNGFYNDALLAGAEMAIEKLKRNGVAPHQVQVTQLYATDINTGQDSVRCATALAAWKAFGHSEEEVQVMFKDGEWHVEF